MQECTGPSVTCDLVKAEKRQGCPKVMRAGLGAGGPEKAEATGQEERPQRSPELGLPGSRMEVSDMPASHCREVSSQLWSSSRSAPQKGTEMPEG